MAIYFFEESVKSRLVLRNAHKAWIKNTIQVEGKTLRELNYVFCSDEYLLNINQEYLQHDTYTDIVTFDNSENENEINGDIFISVDRVAENAKKFKVHYADELRRVMIHGALHLLSYGDKKQTERKIMREKEEHYLNRYKYGQ